MIFFDDFPVVVIENFFVLDKVMNTGAAFSIFQGKTIFLVFISVLALYYIHKSIIVEIDDKFGLLGGGILIGGIVGNLFDRIIYGEVIDFLSFNFFDYSFPVFNFADMFICIGVLLLIINFLRGGSDENKSK